ncbi:MAG: hypothetical protein WC397_01995 [Candidatus Paceibacterota bacterium]|jgi:hypothetical protein
MNKKLNYALVGISFLLVIVGAIIFANNKNNKSSLQISGVAKDQPQPAEQNTANEGNGSILTSVDVENAQKAKRQQEIDDKDRESNKIFKPEGTNWMWEVGGVPWYASLNEDGSTSIWNYHGYGPVAGRWAMSEGKIYINDKGIVEGAPAIRVEARKRSGFDYYDHSLYFIIDGKEYLMEKI